MKNKISRHIKTKSWQLPLFIVLMIFGMFLVTQYRTQVAVRSNLESLSLTDLTQLVINLNDYESTLTQELEASRQQLTNLQNKLAAGLDTTATTQNQIKKLEMLTGAVAIQGQGISITITGESFLIYHDLINLANELFVTGAEAVAINNIRLTASTEIGEAEDDFGNPVITVNGETLLSPIIIKAIGNPNTLEKGLTFTGGIINKFNTIYQVYPTVKKESLIIIPAVKQQNKLYLSPAPSYHE